MSAPAPAQRPDDIPASTAPNAYHVGVAKADAENARVCLRSTTRARELMALALAPGISAHESTVLMAKRLEEWDEKPAHELADLTRRLFAYLDIVEESDSGSEFHPAHISCCRAGWTEDMERILAEMRALVVAEPVT